MLAPLVHEFGWALDDWPRLARGTVIGHLLECAGQVTGGYFADPGVKDVPDLAHLGFPFCDVDADGDAVLGKVAGTGGRITLRTVKEQLLYEVTDPTGYLTPDVIADFSGVHAREVGPIASRCAGAPGARAPARSRSSVGYLAGYVGEGEISYAGVRARERARLAGAICASGCGRSAGRAHRVHRRRQHPRRRLRPPARALRGARARGGARGHARARGARRRRGRGARDERPGGRRRLRKLLHERVGIVSVLLDRARVKCGVTVLSLTVNASCMSSRTPAPATRATR